MENPPKDELPPRFILFFLNGGKDVPRFLLFSLNESPPLFDFFVGDVICIYATPRLEEAQHNVFTLQFEKPGFMRIYLLVQIVDIGAVICFHLFMGCLQILMGCLQIFMGCLQFFIILSHLFHQFVDLQLILCCPIWNLNRPRRRPHPTPGRSMRRMGRGKAREGCIAHIYTTEYVQSNKNNCSSFLFCSVVVCFFDLLNTKS
mmetsp:Transcript_514/g.1064  ORF Transcript_514/g.1064 Transcript_514/m.1064 type:complete len:203 (-) Transcript_514:24-632(-)